MKFSLAKLLTVITGFLVVVLVSVFAVFAKTAFERQRDAAHILSVVTVKRDLLQAQEALRVEGGPGKDGKHRHQNHHQQAGDDR